MEKLRRDALSCAIALAGMSACGGLSSGRAISAFYAQTGNWSWLGIGVSGVIFGMLMAGILRMRRKTGAHSLPAVYAGMFGRRGGAAFTALHAAFCAVAACVLLGTAKDAAALALPMHRADIIGVASALAFSLWIAVRSNAGVKKTGGLCFVLLAGMMFALMAAGKFPGHNTLHFYVELRLENRPWTAVLLALVHASLAAGMCAAAAVRLYPLHIKPGFGGLASAVCFGMMMLAGNGVFSVFPKEINALKYPFVALSASWGTAGFYTFALLRWLESTVCLCGIFCMMPAKKS